MPAYGTAQTHKLDLTLRPTVITAEGYLADALRAPSGGCDVK